MTLADLQALNPGPTDLELETLPDGTALVRYRGPVPPVMYRHTGEPPPAPEAPVT